MSAECLEVVVCFEGIEGAVNNVLPFPISISNFVPWSAAFHRT